MFSKRFERSGRISEQRFPGTSQAATVDSSSNGRQGRGWTRSAKRHKSKGSDALLGKTKGRKPTEQQKDQRRKRSGRGPPSEEALELSSTLKKLSQDKNWNEAYRIFHDASNDGIRDAHHACIMVDMAARCGRISDGEIIFKKLEDEKKFISVEMKTALLKGFAHSGRMAEADALFHSMCSSKSKSNHPNVRTLNTLLRGCLWSAACVSEDGNSIVGGVVSAERAWDAYKKLKSERDSESFDVSSYEYSIVLLCQALRTDDAKRRIQELKDSFGFTEFDETRSSQHNSDQSMTEVLAVVYLALSRAHAILCQGSKSIEACNVCIEYARASKAALESSTSFSRKRGRKERNDEGDRRNESNSVFRGHKLAEIEKEASTIVDICQKCIKDSTLSVRDLTRRLATRLIYLGGGGTSDQNVSNNCRESSVSPKYIQRELVNSMFFSFGLSALTSKLGIHLDRCRTIPLTQKESNRILGAVGLQGGVVNGDCKLELRRIFSAGIGVPTGHKRRNNKFQRVEVELGAGFGDWIVRKAIETPTTSYIAVELRADRVAQICARTVILSTSKPINNLCVVGGESGHFLSEFVPRGSIDTVYINHPEPPTQTYGIDSEALLSIMRGGEEPAHMLHSNVLHNVAASLKRTPKSKIVIVTDNKWYARLICATIKKVKSERPGLLRNVDLSKADDNFREVVVPEIWSSDGDNDVSIFEGLPNEAIGYPSTGGEDGNSYFDRLWRAGGGTHANTRARYILVQESTKREDKHSCNAVNQT